MEQIKIKYFTDKIDKLAYIDGKSDWIDLRASEEVTLKQGEFALVPLGVAMELPKGYEAHIVPRAAPIKFCSDTGKSLRCGRRILLRR